MALPFLNSRRGATRVSTVEKTEKDKLAKPDSSASRPRMARAELERPLKPSRHHPLIRTALIHRLQCPLEAGLAAVAQRDEGLAELLAAGFDAQARVVADTVDGAEDAID